MFLLSQNFNYVMGHFLELLHLGSQRSITILFIAPTLHPYLLVDRWRNDTTFPAFKKFTFANEQANLILCTTFPGCGLTFKARLSALARFRLHFYITIEFDSFHCVRRKTERSRPRWDSPQQVLSERKSSFSTFQNPRISANPRFRF